MKLDFDKGSGLIPAIVQDHQSHRVLMLAYMNEESLRLTKQTRRATFYSRRTGSLWTKGETSGNFLRVIDILADCDRDTLLIKAQPEGPVCHTSADTCFNEANQANPLFLSYLETIIKDRKTNPSEQSYTSSLFKKGINDIARKVGEEAVELVIEAKDDHAHLFKNEAADLLYHLLVLLEAKEIPLNSIIEVLKQRHL